MHAHAMPAWQTNSKYSKIQAAISEVHIGNLFIHAYQKNMHVSPLIAPQPSMTNTLASKVRIAAKDCKSKRTTDGQVHMHAIKNDLASKVRSAAKDVRAKGARLLQTSQGTWGLFAGSPTFVAEGRVARLEQAAADFGTMRRATAVIPG